MNNEIIYCVYLTTYSGDKLPPYYIGSSNLKRIQKGYKGSVSSKQWYEVWKKELKQHPELFSIKILSTHKDRKEALAEENRLQKELDVVKSDLYINKSYAVVNDFIRSETIPPWNKGKKIPYKPCNRDCFGEKNSFYGKTHSYETRQKIRNKLKGRTKETHDYLKNIAEKKKKLNKFNCEGIRRQIEAVTKFKDDEIQLITKLYEELKSFTLVHKQLNELGIQIAYTTVVSIYNKTVNNYERKKEPFKPQYIKDFLKQHLLEGKNVKYIKQQLELQFNIFVTEKQINLFKYRHCNEYELQIIKQYKMYMLNKEEINDVVLKHKQGQQLKQIWKDYKIKYPNLTYSRIFRIWNDFKFEGEING